MRTTNPVDCMTCLMLEGVARAQQLVEDVRAEYDGLTHWLVEVVTEKYAYTLCGLDHDETGWRVRAPEKTRAG